MMLYTQSPLKNETELVARCRLIEGLTFAQLASTLGVVIPSSPIQRKGLAGQLIELALGVTAGNQCAPDFLELGVELKTIPVNQSGKPAESTFITTIPLLTVHQQTWETSQCFSKLKRVLWIPIEGDRAIPFHSRRIGRGILWSPSTAEEQVLKQDWCELTLMIGTGQLAAIDATIGEYLQVRPKAADAKSLCYGFDEEGNTIQTLPRGFYLRSRFTARIISS
jgi:DNA mismatch repair protein MutH